MRLKTLVTATILGMALTISTAEAKAPAKWKKCATCHGEDGKGKTKMGEKLKVKDLSAAAWQKGAKDDDIKATVRGTNKKAKHKAFGEDKLSDQELAEVIKYIRSLK